MRKILILLAVIYFSTHVKAQTPTWSDDVAKIIYKRCSSCHRSGGLGEGTGILLDNYQNAVSVKFGILNAITTKKMPPWPPDPNYRHFKGENILTPYELNQITAWVNGNTPEGNPANAPTPPTYSSGSQMNRVDKTIVTPEYTVRKSTDEYRTFVIPAGISGAIKSICGIEYKPTNSKIVHHIVVYLDPTGAGRTKDAQDSLPGFESTGAGQPVPNSLFMGAWAPGFGLFQLPDNMGLPVSIGSDYLVEMHYAPGSQGQTDSTVINIKYATASIPRAVFFYPWLTHTDSNVLIDYPLHIPADSIKTYKQKYVVPNATNIPLLTLDWTILGTAPHMHKVGVSYKIYNTNGSDTTPIINIPRWRFNWQAAYTLQKPLKLKAYSTIWGEAVYDNTTSNPYNPNTPPIDVNAGEHTSDEMMLGILAVTPYFPGDENIVLDSSIFAANAINKLETQNNYKIYLNPNPSNGSFTLNMENLPTKNNDLKIELLNQLGQAVETWNKQNYSNSYYTNTFDISKHRNGVYYLKITTGDGVLIEKMVKN